VLLGLLLFTAQLLAVHGYPVAAALGTCAACAAEAIALAVAALRPVSGPLRALVGAVGPGGVQALACAVAAIALIGYAVPALARACAHGSDRAHGQPYDPAYAAALFAPPGGGGHGYASAAGSR
jgi:hypothetical protein